jgi:Cu+-exporting ATPase
MEPITKEIAMQVRDPVCGMTIDSTKAATQAQYQGKTYFFCSAQCRRTFDAAPDRYAEERAQGGGQSSSGSTR